MIYYLSAVLGATVLVIFTWLVARRVCAIDAIAHYKPFNPIGAYVPPDQTFIGILCGAYYDDDFRHMIVKSTRHGTFEDTLSDKEFKARDFLTLIPLAKYIASPYAVVDTSAVKWLDKVHDKLSRKMASREPVCADDITETLWAMREVVRGIRPTK